MYAAAMTPTIHHALRASRIGEIAAAMSTATAANDGDPELAREHPDASLDPVPHAVQGHVVERLQQPNPESSRKRAWGWPLAVMPQATEQVFATETGAGQLGFDACGDGYHEMFRFTARTRGSCDPRGGTPILLSGPARLLNRAARAGARDAPSSMSKRRLPAAAGQPPSVRHARLSGLSSRFSGRD